MPEARMVSYHDDESILSAWTFDEEYSDEQEYLAKDDYAGRLIKWQPGKPETARCIRMDGACVPEMCPGGSGHWMAVRVAKVLGGRGQAGR